MHYVEYKLIILKREVINDLRYADDTVLLASNQEDLQTLFDSVIESCEEEGLDLNVPKTQILAMSTQNIIPFLYLGSTKLVDQIVYLGHLLNCKQALNWMMNIFDEIWDSENLNPFSVQSIRFKSEMKNLYAPKYIYNDRQL